jgi:hypothetical protein
MESQVAISKEHYSRTNYNYNWQLVIVIYISISNNYCYNEGKKGIQNNRVDNIIAIGPILSIDPNFFLSGLKSSLLYCLETMIIVLDDGSLSAQYQSFY